MRLHRFFIEKPIGKVKEISLSNGDLFHQLKDVLRFQIGASIILFDNFAEYYCQLTGFKDGGVQFIVIKREEVFENESQDVYLFFSLLKKNNVEWVLEKGTEIGVSNFVPLLSDRSEKKNLNFERAERIIKESAEQSGKVVLPKIHPIHSIEDAFKNFSLHFIALDPIGKKFQKESLVNSKKIGIFVGPEGGWSSHELEFFKKHKIPILHLGEFKRVGSQILRAETACIAVSALILL